MEPMEYSENLCFKCLKDSDDIKIYTIKDRLYCSIFDSGTNILQLCPECRKNMDTQLMEWFYEKPMFDIHGCEFYTNEKMIEKYIDTFPVQGIELFYNQTYDGVFGKSDSKEYIDWYLETYVK